MYRFCIVDDDKNIRDELLSFLKPESGKPFSLKKYSPPLRIQSPVRKIPDSSDK